MKKLFSLICTFTTICAAITSCSKNLEGGQSEASLTDIKVEFSATMPEFKSGEILDTKASMESVVRIRWAKNDRLAVINLTTKKVLGGCMIADNNGINTTFSSSDLVGTIHAGDKFVFILDNQSTIAGATEKDFEPFTIDISSQEGNSDNVPIVVYAEYTATKDNEIEAVNLDFNYLVSYVQLAVAALPARTTITEISIDNIGNSCDFDITGSGAFKVQPKKGSITLTEDFSADGKGAKVRYFSCFESLAQSSAREAHITANGALHSTSWLKAGLSIGYYYQSVATGFTNENIQFVDEAFKAYCVSHYDLNGDGELSFAEAAAITSFEPFSSIEKENIKEIYELSYFSSATRVPDFEGCSALKQVLLPGTLTDIPTRAFKGCTSMESITIPSNVSKIGIDAFAGCTALSHFEGACSSPDKRFLVLNNTIVAYAPAGLTEVTLPNTVTSIGPRVFANNTLLKNVHFTSNLENISEEAFEGCTGLTMIRLFGDISIIGNYAFRNCTNLRSVFCDASIPPVLGQDVFDNCHGTFKIGITSTTLQAYENSKWSDYALFSSTPFNEIHYSTVDNNPITLSVFVVNLGMGGNVVNHTYENGLGIILFDEDVTSIESYAFNNCSTISSMSLPESITSIGYKAFAGCNKMREINLGTSVTDIGTEAFSWCGIENIVIPESTKSIGDYAFQRCGNLSSVTFGNSLESMGHTVFSYCHSLTNISLPNSLTSLGSNTFSYCENLQSVTLGNKLETIPDYMFAHCTLLNNIIFSQACNIRTIGYQAFMCSGITSISLPDSIETIGEQAFYECSNLSNVTFGNSLESIGSSAFYGCNSLLTISLPNTVNSLGVGAFQRCANLESITIGNQLEAIPDDLCYLCSSLNSVEFTSPSRIISIGESSFEGCKLVSINLPDSIESIGEECFKNCEDLRTVHLPCNLQEIPSYSFHCGIETIELPEGITSIAATAFSKILTIYCKPLTPPTIKGGSLLWYLLQHIYVPQESVEAYKTADGWSKYANKITAIE